MNIELRGVSKRFGGTRALDRVSCELAAGQIVAVVGANGAGKTTLLRCLAGVAAPDDGLILYDDQPFSRARMDLRRRLLFLPDFPFVFWEQTPVEHLGLVLRLYGVERAGREEAAVELLRDFDLLPLARKPLGTLSRGQLYKAALATLMAVDPELWLLDEPFASGMDPHGIDAFKRRARAAAVQGRTVLFSTQLLDIAERFADRVCIVHRGELRACETVAALQSRNGGDGGALEQIFRELRAERS
ncbi:MAG: ABC transporter ATP-binding protein [Verrucomicrobia bacterium]|jgi:ABC-type multidrug transport system ATPase subunit|nr:ABC transporter ATP-binding protein [Verrucomicrobiota bacterium]